MLPLRKRLRYFLQREPAAASFLHRFGSALNPYVHFHCCVLDGVFDATPASDGQVKFREAVKLSPQAVAAAQAQVRRRVLHWFVRRGHRHRYHGVLAPNAPLRAAVTALARAPAATQSHPAVTPCCGSDA